MKSQRKFKTSAHKRALEEKYRWRKYAKGLTRRGTPRRLRVWTPNALYPFLDPGRPRRARLTAAEKDLARKRALRDERRKAGMTINGTVRKYRSYPELAGLTGDERRRKRDQIWKRQRAITNPKMNVQEQNWRAFRESMQIKTSNPEDVQAMRNREFYADDAMRMGHS